MPPLAGFYRGCTTAEVTGSLFGWPAPRDVGQAMSASLDHLGRLENHR